MKRKRRRRRIWKGKRRSYVKGKSRKREMEGGGKAV